MAEEKKMEEKKPEEANKAASEEEKTSEKAAAANQEESKDGKETGKDQSPPPLPPPPEIVLKVYMHCEGCARKVRRSLKGFQGVEDVMTDCKSHKVIVKGEKADPIKVLERVQRKSHRQVELISPIPKPDQDKDVMKPNPPEAEPPALENKPEVITAVLRVHMHCEACAHEIRKRILRMKGVESAEADLKGSQVTVKGVLEPPKLVEYVYKRTGKHAAIVKQDPENKAKEEEAAANNNKDSEDSKKEKVKGEDKDKKKDDEREGGKGKKEGEGEAINKSTGEEAVAVGSDAGILDQELKLVELKKNEYYYHPQSYAMELHSYPPQIFSDENPNACSVM